MYKGLDRADVELTGEALVIDEIGMHDSRDADITIFFENHLNARYVSPPEAAMRILGKPLQGKSHAVIPLHVHLPGERLATADEEEAEPEETEEERDNREQTDDPFATDAAVAPVERPLQKSMLEAYFKLNETDSFAREKLYVEIPEYYRSALLDNQFYNFIFRWDSQQAKWLRRGSGSRKVIGRLHSTSVTKPELCRLRLLLLQLKAATSFEDLRRDPFNSHLVHPTFGAACIARGLIVTDEEWVMCMAEAAAEKMPFQLQRLFVTILVHNAPAEPFELFQRFQVLCKYSIFTLFAVAG